MNKIVYTIADFCSEYLQGHNEYTIQGKELLKYKNILDDLVEFSNTKLFITEYSNFTIDPYFNLLDNSIYPNFHTQFYKLNEEVLSALLNSKMVFLYSIKAGELNVNNRRDIYLRFKLVDDFDIVKRSIRFDFRLKSDGLINTITNKLSALSAIELELLNKSLTKSPEETGSKIKISTALATEESKKYFQSVYNSDDIDLNV